MKRLQALNIFELGARDQDLQKTKKLNYIHNTEDPILCFQMSVTVITFVESQLGSFEIVLSCKTSRFSQ